MKAAVYLWGRRIGVVSLQNGEDVARFKYARDFLHSGMELSPLTMPASAQVYRFMELPRATFHGLPGLLADSLPDRFGTAIVNAWLTTQGRTPRACNAVERLCYTGSRGMGALEFRPVSGPRACAITRFDIDAVVRLTSRLLTRGATSLAANTRTEATLRTLQQVATSAGGARAKAIITWNPATQEVHGGPTAHGKGFEHWLLKFDAVSGNRGRERADPRGFGALEYAYHLMARASGITMNDCRLLEENGRRHFMTRRFDRCANGEKLHMQSLGALAHFDFNQPGAYSYEQALYAVRRLGMPVSAVEEQFRRMVFNVLARNQDDHVKNIAYLMDRAGRWSLAPAFDLTYSYTPSGRWTSRHQMSIQGKRDDFTWLDLLACARTAQLADERARDIVEEVRTAVRRWPEFADQAQVEARWQQRITRNLRINLR